MFDLSSVFGSKGIIGSVMDVLKDTGIVVDPETKIKVQQALFDYQVKIEELHAREMETINATMQAEAKSEHWAQWLWRPTIGFSFSAVIVNNYILMPYFSKLVVPIVIPDNVWTAMLVILGAAAATRGWQKVEETKHNGKNGKP